MKKFGWFLVLLVWGNVFAVEPSWEELSRGNTDIKTVLAHPDNPRIIYMGSGKGVFKSEDGAATWRNILLVKGQNRGVNYLAAAPQNKNALYALTGNGLFYSETLGRDWRRLFKGKNYLENECTVFAVSSGNLYLGTKAGLFISADQGRSWQKAAGKIGNNRILAIAAADYIYVACLDGVFVSKDNAKSWERIFVAYPAEDGNEIEEAVDDPDEEERFSDIRYLAIDRQQNRLYLATARGVYQSADCGKSWSLLPDYGLLEKEVKFLCLSDESALYAATERGVFRHENERWHEVSLGLSANSIRFLALDRQNNLYAACDKGLFKANTGLFKTSDKDTFMPAYFKEEPDIHKVQQAAIKYAEVEPQKILRWRKQAAGRAFFPRVSASVNRDTSDLWHWESGSTTKADDDILVRGNDALGWDITLTWDLGEIIWSDAQTSIDVRSRLMVQLREDILDEVTKLYYERLRVKMELEHLDITERKKRQEKELRLEELGAYLDALTGGYFSAQLKK